MIFEYETTITVIAQVSQDEIAQLCIKAAEDTGTAVRVPHRLWYWLESQYAGVVKSIELDLSTGRIIAECTVENAVKFAVMLRQDAQP